MKQNSEDGLLEEYERCKDELDFINNKIEYIKDKMIQISKYKIGDLVKCDEVEKELVFKITNIRFNDNCNCLIYSIKKLGSKSVYGSYSFIKEENLKSIKG